MVYSGNLECARSGFRWQGRLTVSVLPSLPLPLSVRVVDDVIEAASLKSRLAEDTKNTTASSHRFTVTRIVIIIIIIKI